MRNKTGETFTKHTWFENHKKRSIWTNVPLLHLIPEDISLLKLEKSFEYKLKWVIPLNQDVHKNFVLH